MRPLVVGILAALAVATTACSEPGADRTPGPRTLDEFGTPVVAEVGVDDDGFTSTEVELVAGEAISLTNEGDDDLRVVGDAVTASAERADPQRVYDTGTLRPDDTTVLAFPEEARVTLSIDGHEGSTLEVAVAPDPDAT